MFQLQVQKVLYGSSQLEGNTVTVKENLLYTHWGTGVEKAEVGLLTRKIVFQGDEDSNSTLFGGHLIMRPATLHISGVEFTRFGQKGLMGRYPGIS